MKKKQYEGKKYYEIDIHDTVLFVSFIIILIYTFLFIEVFTNEGIIDVIQVAATIVFTFVLVLNAQKSNLLIEKQALKHNEDKILRNIKVIVDFSYYLLKVKDDINDINALIITGVPISKIDLGSIISEIEYNSGRLDYFYDKLEPINIKFIDDICLIKNTVYEDLDTIKRLSKTLVSSSRSSKDDILLSKYIEKLSKYLIESNIKLEKYTEI